VTELESFTKKKRNPRKKKEPRGEEHSVYETFDERRKGKQHPPHKKKNPQKRGVTTTNYCTSHFIERGVKIDFGGGGRGERHVSSTNSHKTNRGSTSSPSPHP